MLSYTVYSETDMFFVIVLSYVEDIQDSYNARKLCGQPDDRLDVNQTYTHSRSCDMTVCFYAQYVVDHIET